MARTIDQVIDYIRAMPNGSGNSDTQKQVMINRLEGDGPPTREELARAHAQVYPEEAAKVSCTCPPSEYMAGEHRVGSKCGAAS